LSEVEKVKAVREENIYMSMHPAGKTQQVQSI